MISQKNKCRSHTCNLNFNAQSDSSNAVMGSKKPTMQLVLYMYLSYSNVYFYAKRSRSESKRKLKYAMGLVLRKDQTIACKQFGKQTNKNQNLKKNQKTKNNSPQQW